MKLERTLNFLQRNIKTLLVIYLIIQLSYVLFSNLSYKSDSLYYFNLAQDCLKLHTFYPAPVHLYQDYIIAPLYINILVLLLSIFNSEITIGLFNIVLNFLQLWLVYKITEKIFSREAARILVIIYIFYLSTLGLILFNFTELMFNVFIFSSIYFYLQKKNFHLFVSGIFLAASIAVRPVGWAVLGAYLICELFSNELIKNNVKKIGLIIFGLVLFVLLFGSFNYSHFGKFIFTSTNGPVNLLIGSNDDATGAYNDKVFEKGKIGYIPDSQNKTYVEKENYWLQQSINWIYKHPLKYVSLFSLKIVHMFIWDDFSVYRLLDLKDWNLYRVIKNIITGNDEHLLGDNPLVLKISYFILLILHHVYYFSIVILFILTIGKNFKAIFKKSNLKIFLIFMMLGITIHLLTFGDARFKYPYIITMMIFIAPVIYQSTVSKKLMLKYKPEMF